MVSFIRFFLMAFMCLLPAIIVLGTTSADLYRIMGVTPDADAGVIKRAYHKLSLKWHPDKNTSPEAEQMFMLIAQAYEILGDIDKRRQYDNSGDSQQQQQQQQQRKRTTDIDLESPVVMQMNFEGGLFSFDYRPPPASKAQPLATSSRQQTAPCMTCTRASSATCRTPNRRYAQCAGATALAALST